MYAVFLDLDGTLVDPKPGITAAIRYAMGELGAEDIPEADDLTWCIGPDNHNTPLTGFLFFVFGVHLVIVRRDKIIIVPSYSICCLTTSCKSNTRNFWTFWW